MPILLSAAAVVLMVVGLLALFYLAARYWM